MTDTAAQRLIRTSEEITEEWLGGVLGRPELQIADVTRIGTGQMSQSHRVRLADGDSVVVKLASTDPNSRGTGVGMGAYAREISFYRDLAERIGGPLAACHLAEYDEAEGWFTLVLEDIEGAEQGDQIAGCTVHEARLAMLSLARLHAPVLGDLHVGALPWLNQVSPINQALMTALLPGFLERYADRIEPAHVEVCERFVAAADAWMEDRRPPSGLVHGDYRLDNLLFGANWCKVVDWQTCSWGPAMLDASYFLGGGLSIEDRRAHERELVGVYHEELCRLGATGLSAETAWEEYRRQAFHNLLMAIVASMVVERTDRGDDMFMATTARGAQQVLDLGALELLPEPGAGKPAPLRPDPADEGRHSPGPEAMWNESWYFDVISDDGSLGAYVRLGRLPNQGIALYTVAVVGPDRPAVLVLAPDAPLPDAADETQLIEVGGLRAEQHCEAPLERFRVAVRGAGEAHEDESAPLRGEAGRPVEVEFDLTWETVGEPYQWRNATRYEIPCWVTGTVRVGEEQLIVSGPGQRDHSWGSRDWWATDWMWSALHLADGTHTHTVTVPQAPGFGVGYIQREDELTEIAAANCTEEVADNGLITRATVTSEDLVTEIEPLAFGALRLEAPDGRVSHFPRAMCRVAAADGRTGLGWIEWNRVQR